MHEEGSEQMKTKRMICLILSLIFCLSVSITAFADDITLAGDKVVKCNVSFSVTDTTNTYTDEIKVIMNDVTGTVKETYTLTKANSYGSGNEPKYSVPAPTTYKIKFEGIKDGYTIVNNDGSEIDQFVASESGHNFHWKIIKLNQKEDEFKIDRSDNDSFDTESNENSDQGQQEREKTQLPFEKGKEPSFNGDTATQIWKKFLDQVSFIKDDPKWSDGAISFLSNYERYQDTYAEEYEKYVKNGTKTDFLKLDLFNRFLYEESYLRLASKMGNGNYSYYFEDENSFEKNVVNEPKTRMSNTDQNGGSGEKVAKAYVELMSWQYAYIQVYHAPYDFITQMNYVEAKSGTNKTENQQRTEDTEIEEKQNEKQGIWNDTFYIISQNLIGCVAVVILGAVLLIVTLKRRKNNIDDK